MDSIKKDTKAAKEKERKERRRQEKLEKLGGGALTIMAKIDEGAGKEEAGDEDMPPPADVLALRAKGARLLNYTAVDKNDLTAPVTKENPTGKVENPVQCKGCTKWLRSWRFCWQTEVIEGAVQNYAHEPCEKRWFEYLCLRCLVNQKEVGEAEALGMITNQGVRYERKRCRDFRDNLNAAQESFPMLSNRGAKAVARSRLQQLWGPWEMLITAKAAEIEMQDDMLRKLATLMSEIQGLMADPIAAAKNDCKIEQLLQETDRLRLEIEALSTRSDFKSKGDKMNDFQLASEYQDEFINTDFGYVRGWYTCVCGCVMASKTWGRRYAEFNSSKQRWYCISCNRRFKTAFGTICEQYFADTKETVWARGDVWGTDMEEIRGKYTEMCGEKKGMVLTTPEEFYASIKGYRPVVGTIFRPTTRADLWDPNRPTADTDLQMSCMLTENGKLLLDQNPIFNWKCVLTLFS